MNTTLQSKIINNSNFSNCNPKLIYDFSRVSTLSSSNIVKLKLNIMKQNHELFLIDTGADICLIKRGCIRDDVNCYPNSKCLITGITSEDVSTLALCYADIILPNSKIISQSFQIVDDLFPIPVQGIIGRNFLKNNQCKIDYCKDVLEIPSDNCIINLKFDVPSVDNSSLMMVNCNDVSSNIPSRSERIMKIKVEFPDGDYVCHSDEIQSGVFIANSILKVKNKCTIVSLLNNNEESIDLNASQSLKLIPFNHYNVFSTTQIYSDNSIVQRLAQLESLIDTNHLNHDEKISILRICRHFNDIFYLEGDKLSVSTAAQHDIPLLPDSRPVNIKPYRLPHSAKAEINSQIEKMLDEGIIENSASAWNSPLLIVPKKSSDDKKQWRVVVDFRRLNNITQDDIYPLPNIADILDQLGNSNYFSTIDLANGYHQIAMNPEDKTKTAFSTEKGHFHFTRMPFGLKGAPATFQRAMNYALTGLTGVKCFVYLDDVVIYGYDLQDHNKKICDVFNALRKFNLKLQPRKCFFLRKEINFLGHVITNNGIKPDPSKLFALQNYPRPKNAKEIKSFLGLGGYYRRFIEDFAKICEPLNALLRKNTQFKWDAFCEESFEKLKRYLMNPPILKYPDFTKTFCVTTDASDFAIGAILSQDYDGQDLPIAFASRVLNTAERNYPTVEKELLAIVWAVKRFRPYVYGTKFVIKTDHKPLIWLNKTSNPSTRLVRWRLELVEYNYEIIYKSGRSNCNADSLSRISLPPEVETGVSLLSDINVMTRSHARAAAANCSDPIVLNSHRGNSTPCISDKKNSSSDLLRGQISPRSSYLDSNSIPLNNISKPNSDSRNTNNLNNSDKIVVLTDEKDISQIIKEFHDNPVGGHQGVARTFNRIKKYYRFSKMLSVIRKYINKCDSCQKNKIRKLTKCPMRITSTSKVTFEKVYMDVVGPMNPVSYNGYKYILTIEDDLSKFVVAIPMYDQEAKTVAKIFVTNFICIYGVPQSIHTDQGSNFMSALFTEVCKILRIKKLNSTAYHPQSNAVERYHRSLGEYFRNFCNKDPFSWDEWLPYACFTQNTTPHTMTNFMPYELVFGNKPNLPSSLHTDPEPFYNYDDFSLEMKNKLQISWKIARENIIQNKEKSKVYYDKKTNFIKFKINDLVLLKSEKNSHSKFEHLWEGPYEIIEINGPENSTIRIKNKNKLVHNNRLVHYNSK